MMLVVWLFVLSAVAYLDRVNVSIAGTWLQHTYGLTDQTLGLIFSAFVLGYMLFQAPMGALADRWGARRTLTFAVIWWAIFTALTASVPVITLALPALMAIRFLLGAGEAAMYPAANRIVAAWVAPADRGRANGIIFTGVGLGAAAAPPLVSRVITGYGWRASFFVCAVIGLVAGVVWFLIARDEPTMVPKEPAKRIPWGAIAADRTVALLTLSYFCYGYAAYIFFTWFFIYLYKVRGVDLKASAVYAALPFLAMAAGSFLGGLVSDALARSYGRRVGRCGVAFFGIAVAAICIGAGTHLADVRTVSLVLAFGAGSLYLAQSAFWSISADIAKGSAGAVSGIMNMGAQFGGVVTASLTPCLANHYGWSTSFAVAGALCVIGALAWLAIEPDRPIRIASVLGLATVVVSCSGGSRYAQLVPNDAKLTKVATGFGFTEGPVWDTSNVLYVSDETQDSIYRVTMDGHKKGIIHLGDPDGNTYDLDGRLIDGASALRAIIAVTPDGKYTILADHYDGKRFNSPNDMVVGPDGALYFTDPTLDLPKGQSQEIPFQGVYRLDSLGNVTLLTKDVTQPNGLAFSPDGHTFYVDDSDTGQRNIRAYDFLPNGTIANGRIFGREPGGPKDGVPDGMRLDMNGNMFVTGPHGIWVWDPHGHHLGTIVMPEQPANLTWGDPDYGTLYITATTSVYRLRTGTHGFVPYHTRPPSTVAALPCSVSDSTATLAVPHVAHAPPLSLDLAQWSQAATASMDRDCAREIRYPKIATEMHGFWSDGYLYLLFKCPYESLNLWLPTTNDVPRPHLWDRDVVEVFLGDDWRNIRHYREFEIAPTGDWIDIAIDLDHPSEDFTWRSHWQTKARIDRQARIWYAAARIPLSAISQQPVHPGTRWRLNLYRIDGQGADPQRHFLCWQPTCSIYRDPNHVPEHFGTLVFAQ